jgi:hypothetical protein
MNSPLTLLDTNGRSCEFEHRGVWLYADCRSRPYPYPGHTHIPFTLEKMCAKIPIVPPEERVDEAVLLGKLTSKSPAHAIDHLLTCFPECLGYFYPDRTGGLSPPEEAWESFHAVTGLWPIANARPLNDDPNEPATTPEGVVNRGPVSRDEYTAEIGHARVFIGIGMPAIVSSLGGVGEDKC